MKSLLPFFRLGRTQPRRSPKQRIGTFESLERRSVLVAEGDVFNLTDSFETAGLVGTPSAMVQWGDGSQSPAAVTSNSQTGDLRVRFNYSLDTTGFFNDPARRSLLDLAAAMVTTKLGDKLTAIQPTGTNRWNAQIFHPATGASISFPNLTIAANEIVVYVGARDLPGNQLGLGGPGGVEASGTSEWLNNVISRGQAGAIATPATDIGPWGGSLVFDSLASWYFGANPAGLQSNQRDFVTVASHELVHLLGLGTAASWNRLVSNQVFTGPKSIAAYDAGGNVPLSSDLSHWSEDILDSGRKTLMGPTISAGVRDSVTGLDLAGLDDIGWDILDIRASITAQHTYPDNGTYPITIVYTGASIGQFSETSAAVITNAPPVLTAAGNKTVIRGETLTIPNIGSISDVGFRNLSAEPPTSESFNYTINWGDGTAIDAGIATIDRLGAQNLPTLASFDGTHTYSTAGTFTVTLNVTDDDNGTTQKTFQVTVVPPPQITIELSLPSIAENAGPAAATLTVRRSGPVVATPTLINLVSSDVTEITVPSSVTIPANASSTTIALNAIDDALLDGTQTVNITATGTGLTTDSATILVTDIETLSATFTDKTVIENIAEGIFFLTIVRSNTDIDSPVTIALTGNIPAEISVPPTVTILAGSREIRVPVQPIDDNSPERSLVITYQMTAPGYVAAQSLLTLLDNEPPLFQNQNDPFDTDGSGTVQALDALRIINLLSRRMTHSLDPDTEAPNGLFVDVNGDYLVSALDALRVINELGRRLRSTGAGESWLADEEERDRMGLAASTDPLTDGLVF